MKNYYKILDIDASASLKQIKKGFRVKAIMYHPDKHSGDEFLSKMFIEVREAYDILSNPNRKEEYDLEYHHFFKEKKQKNDDLNNTTKTNKKYSSYQSTKEEQFYYNPLKSYFTSSDRSTQETAQTRPLKNHFGNRNEDNLVFFTYPKKIGKLVSGFSDLTNDIQPLTKKEKIHTFLISIGVAIVIAIAILLIFQVSSPFWLFIWITLPISIGIWLGNVSNSFSHNCSYVGVNGFALFQCEDNINNIIQSKEVNFDNVTDFIKTTVIHKQNYTYQGTIIYSVWLNDNKVIKSEEIGHNNKSDKPGGDNNAFWFDELSEKYWTIYLLDNMESKIQEKGFLLFNLYYYESGSYRKIPYIELGIGYIKFINSGNSVTYNFNEIKRLYTKGSELFIEHNNYESKSYFKKIGNKDSISLTNLSNRLFFTKAMELLIGYKIAQASK